MTSSENEQHPLSLGQENLAIHAVVERKFQSSNPADKIAEVFEFAKSLGLRPERVFVRIFNRGLIENMRTNGTDRAGIDELDTRKYAGVDLGYTEKLIELGLKKEDGIYVIPLSQWVPDFTNGLFERTTLSIPPHRVAIAIYDGELLKDIVDDSVATQRPLANETSGEFYYFKNPSNKLQALAGIITDEPIEIEQEFSGLPSTKEQIDFLKMHSQNLTRHNIPILQEFIFDLKRSLRLKQHRNPSLLENSQLEALNAIEEAIIQRELEFNFIDDFLNQIQMIRDTKGLTKGTSKEFITENIQAELANPNCSETYRGELLQMLYDVQRLNF